MKVKTISAFILSASSAFALMGPGAREHKTICLETREDKDGVLSAANCDQAKNNATQNLKLLSNGCAEGQISLIDSKYKTEKKYTINIPNCLPPNVVQL
jgi:hypothetical protein